MSFIERNKRWLLPLLPLLGLAGAGVLWVNASDPGVTSYPDAGGSRKAPEEASAPSVASPSNASGDAALAIPPPETADPSPMLAQGLLPLGPTLLNPPGSAALHPRLWRDLPDRPTLRMAALEPPAPGRPTPELPPALDFIIETPVGLEAWMEGRGYREGAILKGGYTLNRITLRGIVIDGPGGEVIRPLTAANRARGPMPKAQGSVS